ncbi:MAG: ATP-binding cassette domain-containing protein [Verrucomicrobia bacterium]|nr:ATP-binding cassette domain-containing protein [Verrucomicrobiota bacterium]
MGELPAWDRAPPVIELQGITKRFGPVEVLSNVDLSLYAGQVHSLAGENGAGKSTLVKILGWIHQSDSGRIVKNGIETTILERSRLAWRPDCPGRRTADLRDRVTWMP